MADAAPLPDDALGELLLVEFDGHVVDDALRALLAAGLVGGVLLFARNVRDANQLRALTAELRAAAGRPLLVAIDHEGGPINRLRAVLGERPGATALGALAAGGRLGAVEAAGAQAAHELADLGINLNLAPVVDVATEAESPALAGRTFGRDAARVADSAAAYLDGMQSTGRVAGCLKHFPGLGAAALDPHRALPVVARTKEELDAVELLPYRRLLACGQVSAILVTHALVPALDPAAPASLAPRVVTGLLRGALGFEGVVVADSLRMGAISARHALPEACVLAARAGCDLLLGARSPAEARGVHAALRVALADGLLDGALLLASAWRIRRMTAASVVA